MILSASRRTDIPCFYGEWFENRLKAGYALTRNPMNHSLISRISLSPEHCDCIVFWTKDPQNLLSRLDEFDRMGYRYCFQFTLTPYDHTIERHLRPKEEIVETFRRLSTRIGKERLLWRYDPILLNDSISIEYHKRHFEGLCALLSPYTERVTISFVSPYRKLNTSLVREITPDEKSEIAGFIGETAKKYGLCAKACCESGDLSSFGIGRASCIDKDVLERVCGFSLSLSSDHNQRKACGCMESIDIGVYNTCRNGCVYCYANRSVASAEKNLQQHDPCGEMLLGRVIPGEKINERIVHSNRIG